MEGKIIIVPGRKVGNTTRRVDYYIQELFTKGKIVVRPYSEEMRNNHIFKSVLKRLESEHSHIFERDKIKHLSKNSKIIELKNEHSWLKKMEDKVLEKFKINQEEFFKDYDMAFVRPYPKKDNSEKETIKVQYQKKTTPRLFTLPQGDWIDIATPIDIYAAKGKEQFISLEVAMELPKGYEAHMVVRSSTPEKWRIQLKNGVAIIDNSYCGPEDYWKAHIIGIGVRTIPAGTRLFQFRIVKKQPEIYFDEVEKLLGPNRGGTGSTGD